MSQRLRAVVRPDHYRPASADFRRIGVQARLRAEECRIGILYVGIRSPIVAADAQGSAAIRARRIDHGLIGNHHLLAEHADLTTMRTTLRATLRTAGIDARLAVDAAFLAGL